MLWLLEVSGVFTARRLENRIGKLKGCPETAGKLCSQVQPDSAKSKEPRGVYQSLQGVSGSFMEDWGQGPDCWWQLGRKIFVYGVKVSS